MKQPARLERVVREDEPYMSEQKFAAYVITFIIVFAAYTCGWWI